MRTHSRWLDGMAAATLCWLMVAEAIGAEPTVLKAMMIRASNEPAAQDARLEIVEYKLRRIFGFEYYRFLNEASATVVGNAEAVLDLGGGHVLRVTTSDSDGGVRAAVRWFRGDALVLNTVVRVARRTPVILGGISEGGGTLIITLVAE